MALFWTASIAMDQRDVYIINNPDYTGEMFAEYLGGVLTARILDSFGMQHLPPVDHIVY